ncbi:MAG: serine hydrolase [Culicoidibacterales bacterium]
MLVITTKVIVKWTLFFIGLGTCTTVTNWLTQSFLQSESQVVAITETQRTTQSSPNCQDDMQNIIESFAGEYPQTYFAIAYFEPTTGYEAYLNADIPIVAASTTKVTLALMVYEQVFNGTLSLTTQISYHAETDYEAGAGVLQTVRNFQQLDVATLVELMIVESDNIAKNILLRTLGGREAMHAYLATVTGIPSDNPTTNEVTARQQLAVLRHLQQETTPGSETIINLMEQTNNLSRLAAIHYPDGSQPQIAHKVGDYVEAGLFYLHDIAIVEAATPFTLVVMTISQPEEEAAVYQQITTLGNKILAS